MRDHAVSERAGLAELQATSLGMPTQAAQLQLSPAARRGHRNALHRSGQESTARRVPQGPGPQLSTSNGWDARPAAHDAMQVLHFFIAQYSAVSRRVVHA